jgi:hypothetical protein
MSNENSKPRMLSPDIMYAYNATNWYDWIGQNKPTRLFYLSSVRLHCNCFSNMYNETASNLFGCNTNIVARVDGRSAMYCTCYTIKSTKEEDDEHFNRSCACMIRKVHKKVKEMEKQRDNGLAENQEDLDCVALGMKS